jgi:hypothetical protein
LLPADILGFGPPTAGYFCFLLTRWLRDHSQVKMTSVIETKVFDQEAAFDGNRGEPVQVLF